MSNYDGPRYMSNTDNKLNTIIASVIIATILVALLFLVTKKSPTTKPEALRQETTSIKKPAAPPPTQTAPIPLSLDYQDLSDSITAISTKKDITPEDYQRFSQSVKRAHQNLLRRLSDELKLSEANTKEVLKIYSDQHDTYTQDYYYQLKELNNSTALESGKDFVTYENYKSANQFSKVLGSTICYLSTFAIKTAISGDVDSELVALFLEKPCTYILSRLLRPLESKLKELALVKDYTISRLRLENHMRSVVAEFATVEDNFEITWNKRFVKELKFWFWDSKADLKIRIRSRVKAGFKLQKFFQLKFDHIYKKIIIILPEPEILSNEVNPEIVDWSSGLLVKIDENKINRMIAEGREWSYSRALEKGMLEDAKKHSERILKTIFMPIVTATDQQYTIDIRYRDSIQIKRSPIE